jgi:AraC-like DNA-binding protein
MNLYLELLVNACMLLTLLFLLDIQRVKSPSRIRYDLMVLFVFLLLMQISYVIDLKLYQINGGNAFACSLLPQLFFGPAFYLYIRKWLGYSKLLFWKHFMHFLPALINLLIFIGLATNGYPYAMAFQNLQLGTYFDHRTTEIFGFAFGCSYLLASILRFRKSSMVVFNRNKVSFVTDYIWFFSVIILSLLWWFLDVIIVFSPEYEQIMHVRAIDLFLYLMFFFFMVYSVYLVRNRTSLITGDYNRDGERKEIPTATVFLDDAEEIQERLEKVMLEQQPFLNEELNLSKLAILAGVSDKKLSILLNHYMNTSFYDYINTFRVDLVKKRLVDPNSDAYTIMAIANDCGFKSKSNFNRTFKRLTGESPSMFRLTNLGKTAAVFILLMTYAQF